MNYVSGGLIDTAFSTICPIVHITELMCLVHV